MIITQKSSSYGWLFASLILVLSLCTKSTDVLAQTVIDDITFEGLKKTKPSYLIKFIACKVGDTLNTHLIEKDVQTLRNLNLFLKVDVTIENKLSKATIVFKLKEALSVLPLVQFGGIKGNFWFQLGVIDLNWQGKGKVLGGYYRYDDRHSFQGFLQTPYLKGSHWGYEFSFLKLSSIEPIYFNGNTVDYNYDNVTVEFLPRYEFRFGHNILFGLAYLNESYDALQQVNDFPLHVDENKLIFKAVHHLKKIDYFFHYLNGYSNQLFIESVITSDSDRVFWKFFNETKYFARIGKMGNLATRFRMGLSTNNGSPFAPFVLDSYINIRGVGNRVSRGTGELVLNVEYRHTLLDKKSGAIQGIFFLDTGSWRTIGENIGSLFEKSNINSYSGLGVRVYSKKIYNLVVRADYAWNLRRKNENGIVLGIGQYF